MRVIIVIPVYNHPDTLKDVVLHALDVHDTVLVVDDGSAHRAEDILKGIDRVHIIRHEKNLGKGAAILSAVPLARRLNMTHMVTMDADGQHDPDDVKLFMPVIKKYSSSVIVGKRDFQGPHVPGSTRFGRKFSNFWLRLQTGQSIGDTQSGFRAYPLFVLENLKLREKRYAFEIEVLVKAAWAGIELKDVPVSVHYPPAGKRISHFHKLKDNFRLSGLNTKFTLRSVLPWPHKKIVSHEITGEKITALHPIRSIKTLLTENATPLQLAAAAALGVLLGTLPLIACHTIAIIFAAGYLRLNKVVALSASQLCMPPFVPALCIEAGYFIRHGTFLTEISMKTLGYQVLDRFYEYLIGSVVLAPVLAVAMGSIVYLTATIITAGKNAATG